MTTNGYAEAARERKAAALARVMRDARTAPEAARALDASGRRIIEAAARVNPSSDETWTLAFSKLERMQSGFLDLPDDMLEDLGPKGPRSAAIPDDPYRGLPGASQ